MIRTAVFIAYLKDNLQFIIWPLKGNAHSIEEYLK